MTLFRPSPFLRRVLLADAAISGAAGLLMGLGANALDEPLGVTMALLRYSGLSLLPFAALLVYLATRESLSPQAVTAVIAYNALWAAASILILLTGWLEPTVLGEVFVIAQAVAVAILAELEYLGLRRSLAVAA